MADDLTVLIAGENSAPPNGEVPFMSSSGNRFKHESLQDCESIVSYLDALKEGFQSGALLFSMNGSELVLRPEGLINLNLEAKKKGEEVKLTIRLRWSEEEETQDSESSPLNIQPLKAD